MFFGKFSQGIVCKHPILRLYRGLPYLKNPMMNLFYTSSIRGYTYVTQDLAYLYHYVGLYLLD